LLNTYDCQSPEATDGPVVAAYVVRVVTEEVIITAKSRLTAPINDGVDKLLLILCIPPGKPLHFLSAPFQRSAGRHFATRDAEQIGHTVHLLQKAHDNILLV
jgi:hypothetical protein